MDGIDSSSLERTVQHLRQALEAYEQYRDEALEEVVRSAVVQNFNVCWGRIRPTISRALIRLDGLDRDEVMTMSLGQLLRTANESGYTTVEWAQWKKFLDARNESAHEYNEPVADRILEQAPGLVQAATEILAVIRRKETL